MFVYEIPKGETMRIFSTPAINQICKIQNKNKLPFKAGISVDTFECTTKPVQKNDLLQNWLNFLKYKRYKYVIW